MLEQIAAAGLTPPNLKELAAALGQKPEAIQVLLELCVEDGLLVEIGDGLFYPPTAIDQARCICQAKLAELGTATLSQLREAWGVTRKYAIPLGEFFDTHHLTLREGDLRRAGPRLEMPWESVT